MSSRMRSANRLLRNPTYIASVVKFQYGSLLRLHDSAIICPT
jgi:hypothetical protein